MISRLLFQVVLFAKRNLNWLRYGALALFIILPILGLIGSTIFKQIEWHESRGAKAINYEASTNTALAESFSTPEYLDQGWDKNDSLWFYNTTQGSAFMPYDFLLAMEQPGLNKIQCKIKKDGETAPWFLCDKNIDRYRYLPQDESIFNPDALPVGFTKETYQGKDYVGLTCAACHTTQINFKNPGKTTARAIRIDGAPAYADMVMFLTELTRAMKLTRNDATRLKTFIDRVVALDNDYSDTLKGRALVATDLKKWINSRDLYNTINEPTFTVANNNTGVIEHKIIDYGYARVDAFGRIF
ncbi:MAG: hypothetical protein JKY92_07405, partial [Magnetovibrio sp.]|nr:hypothetical protein [Magnetovibrio sp.]